MDGYKFEMGKGVTMRDGKDVTIVATGYMVHVALEAAEALKAEGEPGLFLLRLTSL